MSAQQNDDKNKRQERLALLGKSDGRDGRYVPPSAPRWRDREAAGLFKKSPENASKLLAKEDQTASPLSQSSVTSSSKL